MSSEHPDLTTFEFSLSNMGDGSFVSHWTKMTENKFEEILGYAKETFVLKDICEDYSAEGGFQLPFTAEVPGTDKTKQSSRQLRFTNDNHLRQKDWDPWTKDEVDTLIECFKKAGIEANASFAN